LPRAFAALADGRRPYLHLRRGSTFLFDLLFFLAALGKRPPKGRAEAAARGSEQNVTRIDKIISSRKFIFSTKDSARMLIFYYICVILRN
jgi:hypothetical protein